MLYYNSNLINKIVLFLVILFCIAIYSTHDYLDFNKVYLLSILYSIIAFLIILVAEKTLVKEFSKWNFSLSIYPLVYLLFFKFFSRIYRKIFNIKPLLFGDIETNNRNYFYFVLLIYIPLFIAFKLGEFIKLSLL